MSISRELSFCNNKSEVLIKVSGKMLDSGYDVNYMQRKKRVLWNQEEDCLHFEQESYFYFGSARGNKTVLPPSDIIFIFYFSFFSELLHCRAISILCFNLKCMSG